MNHANPLDICLNAFPSSERESVISLLSKLDFGTTFNSSPDSFTVSIHGEKISIPERIYCAEPNEELLNDNEKLLLDCLFTRHHDGHIRERRLKKILLNPKYFVTPFVVRLMGEYVVEILRIIHDHLSDNVVHHIVRFNTENLPFFEKTTQRITSYWNCYYRIEYPDKKTYVGYQILQRIADVANTETRG